MGKATYFFSAISIKVELASEAAAECIQYWTLQLQVEESARKLLNLHGAREPSRGLTDSYLHGR